MFEEYMKMEELYNEAYKLYSSEEYQKSMSIFLELGEYKDSLLMSKKCNANIIRLQQATTISAGIRFSAAISENGHIYLSGTNNLSLIQEVENWEDVVSLCTKGDFVIGLKKDGTVLYASEKTD